MPGIVEARHAGHGPEPDSHEGGDTREQDPVERAQDGDERKALAAVGL